MSMIWGGKLDSKLSDATSLVAKLNYANTYGRLHYSVKAYPSPALNNNEWEIVFKILETILDGNKEIPKDYEGTSWYLDNDYVSTLDDDTKAAFRKRYVNRPTVFKGTEEPNDDDYTYQYDNEKFGTDFGASYLKISQLNLDGYENYSEHYNSDGTIKNGHESYYEAKAMPEYIIYKIRQELAELNHIGKIETNISHLEVVDRMEKCLVTNRDGFKIDAKKQLDNLFRYYADDRSESYTIYYDAKTMLPLMPIKDDIFKDDVTTTLTVKSNNGWFSNDQFEMAQKMLFNGIAVSKRDLYNLLKKIELDEEQVQNFINQLNGEINSAGITSYWGYYFENLNQGTGPNTNYYDVKIIDPIFKIKIGTTYYKWTRTVKYQEYEDDSVLGQSFIIDADTFPADYRIVGETYIRNQKTGKDERYQITIFKANVSSDTSITLQADGDPTTFTMDIDVLAPENDIMMELRQLDVEEDRFEGGTRIVPQRGKYTYTPSMEDYGEVLTPIDNNEIY